MTINSLVLSSSLPALSTENEAGFVPDAP